MADLPQPLMAPNNMDMGKVVLDPAVPIVVVLDVGEVLLGP